MASGVTSWPMPSPGSTAILKLFMKELLAWTALDSAGVPDAL
jgi:hypothetical protein